MSCSRLWSRFFVSGSSRLFSTKIPCTLKQQRRNKPTSCPEMHRTTARCDDMSHDCQLWDYEWPSCCVLKISDSRGSTNAQCCSAWLYVYDPLWDEVPRVWQDYLRWLLFFEVFWSCRTWVLNGFDRLGWSCSWGRAIFAPFCRALLAQQRHWSASQGLSCSDQSETLRQRNN